MWFWLAPLIYVTGWICTAAVMVGPPIKGDTFDDYLQAAGFSMGWFVILPVCTVAWCAQGLGKLFANH